MLKKGFIHQTMKLKDPYQYVEVKKGLMKDELGENFMT